jgi:hypothetical protein
MTSEARTNSRWETLDQVDLETLDEIARPVQSDHSLPKSETQPTLKSASVSSGLAVSDSHAPSLPTAPIVHPANGMLPFDFNNMDISSNASTPEGHELLQTVDGGSTTVELEIAKKLFCRALDIRSRNAFILEGLENTSKRRKMDHSLDIDNSREDAALRVLLNSYHNHRLRQEEATIYASDTIARLNNSLLPPEQWHTCKKRLEQLSNMLDKNPEFDVRCREAMAGVELGFDFKNGLECRNFIAMVLIENHGNAEALNILLHGFTDYLSTRSSPNGPGPFSNVVFKESLADKLKTNAFKQMLELLQVLHMKMDQSGLLKGAITMTARLQAVAGRRSADLGYFLIDAMRLGFEYSRNLMPERADLIFDFVIPELLLRGYEGILLERDKFFEFEKYAQHCRESKNSAGLEVASSYLASSASIMAATLEIDEEQLVSHLFRA